MGGRESVGLHTLCTQHVDERRALPTRTARSRTSTVERDCFVKTWKRRYTQARRVVPSGNSGKLAGTKLQPATATPDPIRRLALVMTPESMWYTVRVGCYEWHVNVTLHGHRVVCTIVSQGTIANGWVESTNLAHGEHHAAVCVHIWTGRSQAC